MKEESQAWLTYAEEDSLALEISREDAVQAQQSARLICAWVRDQIKV